MNSDNELKFSKQVFAEVEFISENLDFDVQGSLIKVGAQITFRYSEMKRRTVTKKKVEHFSSR